ncbi:hypothetical protein WS63_03410 [Burkholderia stagnalis]|nr:hypothetical protein WS63_03410 [Burkholderia stagnalis]KVL93063.1 hypothetical protein WT03_18825 [Burkholderia stagnalis]KVL94760.1 hypothetical protein WT02_17995 [Burkholderia stagnalis]KVM13093.1 hypothetical protein WT04_11315 [Burkholderia stagnalis]
MTIAQSEMRRSHRVIRQSDFQAIFLAIYEHSRCSARKGGFKDSPHGLRIAQRDYFPNVVQTFCITSSRLDDDDVKTHWRSFCARQILQAISEFLRIVDDLCTDVERPVVAGRRR